MNHNLPIVVFGSSNPDGYTRKAVDLVFGSERYEVVDLSKFHFVDYSYKGDYPEDDEFMDIITIVLEYDQIIFATPIYWYSMSSVCKRFFDRISDIYYNYKELSSKFEYKTSYLITSYGDGKKETRECMDYQFISSVRYLKMSYGGSFYYYSSSSNSDLIESNSTRAAGLRHKIFGGS